MKVAIVHDYIREFGGAERVLEALCEAFPEAPIYTAFVQENGTAYEHFQNRDIRVSWAAKIPGFIQKLHSPLRFLAPQIWNSFDFSGYDVVITSASWYVTKGIRKSSETVEVCYCHTPPRWLYGYKTSIEFQKYLPIKLYAQVVGAFMRRYDYAAAQRVNFFIANSQETRRRIQEFYNRNATVIYPPVSLPMSASSLRKTKKEQYYFMVARLVGAKGLDMAVKAAIAGGFQLKIAGAPAGYYSDYERLKRLGAGSVAFLGHVTDEELVNLYKGAKGFLALATDEDFGITPVESMLCGTPVIAFNGGGYKETVIDGKTGIFFDESTVESLLAAMRKFETMKFKEEDCLKQAEKFSKERFIKEIKEFIDKRYKAK